MVSMGDYMIMRSPADCGDHKVNEQIGLASG